jgi:transcription antitermination protein NusB
LLKWIHVQESISNGLTTKITHMPDFSNAVNQKLHDRVFVLLYQREYRNDPVDKLNEMTFAEDLMMLPINAPVIKLTEEIIDKIEELDAIIEEFLKNWSIERIQTCDKQVLRIGIYQLLFSPLQAPSIVIDRAVRIAKKYGDLDSGKFVNGILGAVYRKYAKKSVDVEEANEKIEV